MTTPDPALAALDRLIGTWKVTSGAEGTVTYRWLVEGRSFLLQDVALTHEGTRSIGLEVIGREKPFGAVRPGAEIKSRYYGHEGETFDYVYELNGDTLTIWGGASGSPAYYRGTFSADGATVTGAWVYPGGGYDTTMTKLDEQ